MKMSQSTYDKLNDLTRQLSEKINIYFNGDYYTSTNQSKTCKQALLSLVERLETRKNSMGGLSTLDAYILKNKHLLKASFDKGR